jgi:tripartite-type tricarboxylate transporter receptor subunit TctC
MTSSPPSDRHGRRTVLTRTAAAAGSVLVLRVAPAWAAPFPSGPVRVIVGFPPGGGTDLVARAISRGLTDVLKNSFFVENRSGAAGNIAAALVARAKPDGYTVLAINVPHVVNGSIYRSLPYDPLADFAPIAKVASTPMVLTVAQDSPIKDLQGLIAEARAKPGQLTFSSGGAGTVEHLCGAVLGQEAKIDVTHVPYKGSGESLRDLISGRISFGFNTMPSVLGFLRSDALRPLAVASAIRVALLPAMPTMVEAGLPNVVLTTWYGLLAPKATPAAAIEIVNAAVAAALKTPAMVATLAQLGADAEGGSPEAFGAFMKAEAARFRIVVDALDLHID